MGCCASQDRSNEETPSSAKRRKIEPPPPLPLELWAYILQLLDFDSVYKFSRCCRYFRFKVTESLQDANLFRYKISTDVFLLLKDAGPSILVLNLSFAPSLTADDLLECFNTMVHLVTLNISHTGITIPSFVRISQNLANLQHLTMDLLYTQVREDNVFNQHTEAFSRLKYIHFHAQDWIIHDLFWANSLTLVDDSKELFELQLTLYHENQDFTNMIPQVSTSAPKLTFKKLTISTVTVTNTSDDIRYSVGAIFFEQFISKKWQFVLFKTREQFLFMFSMQMSDLFLNSLMHCKEEFRNNFVVRESNFNILHHFKLRHIVLHLWHPSLFERNNQLSKEIVMEIEKKYPMNVVGDNSVVVGSDLTITQDQWKESERKIHQVYIFYERMAIAGNKTVNFTILDNITAMILVCSYLDFDTNDIDYFFYQLFQKCPNLDTFELNCFGLETDGILSKACRFIDLAKNLRTLKLTGRRVQRQAWLNKLSRCKKIENVEFGHYEYKDNNEHGPLICREELFKFIEQSENLKCMSVCFQFLNFTVPVGLAEKMAVLKESFECANERNELRSLYFEVKNVGRYSHINVNCEPLCPIYKTFLKPLLKLKKS